VTYYFGHPYSSWEKGTVENRNGLIRRVFPKGTDFSQVSPRHLLEVQHTLNNRPRKVLNFLTPKEMFDTFLSSPPQTQKVVHFRC